MTVLNRFPQKLNIEPLRKLKLLIPALMLISWTPSLGQIGKDTVKCYGISELKQIASSLIESKSCDTLLSNAYYMINNRDSLLYIKDREIIELNKSLVIKDNIISIKKYNLDITSKKLKIAEVKSKHSYLGFTLMFGIASTLLIYTIIH
jgi:hypothetical protein